MTTATAIPFVDLRAQHEEIRAEVEAGWRGVLEATTFIGGPQVLEFERAFADFTGVRHCVGVANGTDALELALRAAGIGAGDEVIVPANTFIASAVAVHRAGAVPLFVDCDPSTYLVSIEDAERRVTPRTRAIMPVHLYGQLAPMEDVCAFAKRHRLLVVEDAAQSHGATRHGRAPGSFGVAAGVSFYPGKNLGAYGDAGACLTDDDEMARRLLGLRSYGSPAKYEHPRIGFNSRLDSLQAVVLSAKLRRLRAWNERRRAAAARYDELLAGLEGVTRPVTLPGNEHVWHLYVVRVSHRDRVAERLAAAGIGVGVHYPRPLHLLGAFSTTGPPQGSFPAAEAAAGEILSLPMHPHLTPDDQEAVVDELRTAL